MAESAQGGPAPGEIYMTPREGRTCAWCGFVVRDEQETLCVTCPEWTETVGKLSIDQALAYAAGEKDKERAAARKRWEAKR